MLGEASDDAIGSLKLIASIQELRGGWAAATSTLRNVLKLCISSLGEANWKVTDARLALQDLERRAGMTPEQRLKLAEADRIYQQMMVSYRARKYAEAVKAAEQVLAIRKEVLGERHVRYAECLNVLALMQMYQGYYATAKPVIEQALAITKELLSERHPDFATTIDNQGNLLQLQGDYAVRQDPF